jgi:hypothetical protein
VQKQGGVAIDEDNQTSLLTNLPIPLRGFMEFDQTVLSKWLARHSTSQQDDFMDRDPDADHWDNNPCEIIGSYQSSSLMEFTAWDILTVSLAHSVA